MTKYHRIFLPVALVWIFPANGLVADPAPAPVAANLGPPKARDETVARAQKLVQIPDFGSLPSPKEMKDPFDPADFKVQAAAPDSPAVGAGPAGPTAPPPVAPEVARLAAIAAELTPDGQFTIRGVTYLVFNNGDQRKKVGDTLGIIYKGMPYVLTITKIEETKFTISLDGQEATRDIKSK
jgi:hypothetical protein